MGAESLTRQVSCALMSVWWLARKQVFCAEGRRYIPAEHQSYFFHGDVVVEIFV